MAPMSGEKRWKMRRVMEEKEVSIKELKSMAEATEGLFGWVVR